MKVFRSSLSRQVGNEDAKQNRHSLSFNAAYSQSVASTSEVALSLFILVVTCSLKKSAHKHRKIECRVKQRKPVADELRRASKSDRHDAFPPGALWQARICRARDLLRQRLHTTTSIPSHNAGYVYYSTLLHRFLQRGIDADELEPRSTLWSRVPAHLVIARTQDSLVEDVARYTRKRNTFNVTRESMMARNHILV